MHPRELQLIDAFLRKSERERQRLLLSHKKHRAKFLAQLHHFCFLLDDRFIKRVEPTANLHRTLIELGAGRSCHLISVDPALDGRELSFDQAVEAAARTEGTLLDCVPGRLAYYHGEEPLEGCWLLQKPAPPH